MGYKQIVDRINVFFVILPTAKKCASGIRQQLFIISYILCCIKHENFFQYSYSYMNKYMNLHHSSIFKKN